MLFVDIYMLSKLNVFVDLIYFNALSTTEYVDTRFEPKKKVQVKSFSKWEHSYCKQTYISLAVTTVDICFLTTCI